MNKSKNELLNVLIECTFGMEIGKFKAEERESREAFLQFLHEYDRKFLQITLCSHDTEITFNSIFVFVQKSFFFRS